MRAVLPSLMFAKVTCYTVYTCVRIYLSRTCKVVGDIAGPRRSGDGGERPQPNKTDDGKYDQINILQPTVTKDLTQLDHFVFSIHGDSEIGD